MKDSEANPSTVLQIPGSVQHFAEAELDRVQLFDSRSTNATNKHASMCHKTMRCHHELSY